MEIREEIPITHSYGIHARPSAMIANISMASNSKVTLEYKGHLADGREALDLMSLGAAGGEKILIEVIGEDAEPTFKSLLEAFQNNFGL